MPTIPLQHPYRFPIEGIDILGEDIGLCAFPGNGVCRKDEYVVEFFYTYQQTDFLTGTKTPENLSLSILSHNAGLIFQWHAE